MTLNCDGSDAARLAVMTIVVFSRIPVLAGLRTSRFFAWHEACVGMDVRTPSADEDKPMLAIQQATIALLATLLSIQALQPRARAHDGPTAPHPSAVPAHADGILGHWQRGEGEAIIEIRQQADGYHGVIVASDRQPGVVGTEIFKSLRFDAEEGLWRGRVYSIERERDFKIQMSLPDPDRFVIRLRVLFFSRSVEFIRKPALQVATAPAIKR